MSSKMWSSLILVSFVVYGIVYLLLKYTIFNYWQKRNVPFIKPNFIFGNIWDVISLRKTWATFVHDMHYQCSEERYTGVFFMFQPALIICDLEIIKDILVKDFDSFQDNWFEVEPKVDPLMALAPFVRKGREWKFTRSLLTPQFTTAKIKSSFPRLQEVCNNMVQYLHRESNTNKSTCFELTDLGARFTGDAVMSVAFSLEAKSFFKKIPETFIIDGTSSGLPPLLITFKRTFGLLSRSFSRIFNATFYGDPITDLFSNIITSAVNDRLKTNAVRNDFLNYLMDLSKKHKIADSELAGYAYVFFLDGFETSYVVMAYALLELSLNLDIQETARMEVYTVLQKHNGEITFEAHKELNYLERVVLETVRKYSLVKAMTKVCTRNYTMIDAENGKSIEIEKGTPVAWSLRAIHHNPKYYPEPDKFDPDRFTEEAKQTRPKHSFQGFADGPRICLGRRFAVSEIVVALASILAEFDLQFNKKTTLPIVHDSFHVTDVPVSGLYVDFIPRNVPKL